MLGRILIFFWGGEGCNSLVFLSRFVCIPSLVVNRVVRGISDKESKAQKGGPGSGITTRGIGISSVIYGSGIRLKPGFHIVVSVVSVVSVVRKKFIGQI